MKTKDVVIGKVYAAKVSERVVPVRVIRDARPSSDFYGRQGSPRFWGVNEVTGREVGPFTSARLRFEVESYEADGVRRWRRCSR